LQVQCAIIITISPYSLIWLRRVGSAPTPTAYETADLSKFVLPALILYLIIITVSVTHVKSFYLFFSEHMLFSIVGPVDIAVNIAIPAYCRIPTTPYVTRDHP
jgi:hypothetical protein